jgi:predicted alpha/beta hydrolase family esterase
MRAYLFRGALGPIFSRGMDHLAERIEKAGIPADVNEFAICNLIAGRAIREYREDPALIILIGHSMGGYCVLKFSEMLQAQGIRVSLAVMIEPPCRSISSAASISSRRKTSSAAATSNRRKVFKVTSQASISRSMTKSTTSMSTRWTASTNK